MYIDCFLENKNFIEVSWLCHFVFSFYLIACKYFHIFIKEIFLTDYFQAHTDIRALHPASASSGFGVGWGSASRSRRAGRYMEQWESHSWGKGLGSCSPGSNILCRICMWTFPEGKDTLMTLCLVIVFCFKFTLSNEVFCLLHWFES